MQVKAFHWLKSRADSACNNLLDTLPVEFSPSALSDLQETLDYYTEQGVAATGQRIVRELINATKILPDYPEMGRIVSELNTPLLRELIRPPHRIVYRLDPKCIAIIRIWRSERLLNLPNNG